jgi:hypothetical protein
VVWRAAIAILEGGPGSDDDGGGQLSEQATCGISPWRVKISTVYSAWRWSISISR